MSVCRQPSRPLARGELIGHLAERVDVSCPPAARDGAGWAGHRQRALRGGEHGPKPHEEPLRWDPARTSSDPAQPTAVQRHPALIRFRAMAWSQLIVGALVARREDRPNSPSDSPGLGTRSPHFQVQVGSTDKSEVPTRLSPTRNRRSAMDERRGSTGDRHEGECGMTAPRDGLPRRAAIDRDCGGRARGSHHIGPIEPERRLTCDFFVNSRGESCERR